MRRQGITRRDFIKGAAAGAVGVAAVSMLGCNTPSNNDDGSSKSTEEQKSSEAESSSDEAKQPTGGDGKYVTKAMGHEADIWVQTTFRDGAIVECKVLAHEETIGIGNYACQRIPALILANQSVNVPNVRGCSISSMAIKAAVTEAIELAGYDVANFSKEVKREVVDANITEEADVVVMGAGTAGLIAANRLLDLGKKVIVVEKKDIPGGSMPMTYGGILNCGSEMMKKAIPATYAAGMQDTAENYDAYWRMSYFDYLFHKEYDRFNNGRPYMTAWFKACGPMVDWMSSIGIGFAPIGKYEAATQYGTTLYLAPGCYEGGPGYAAMYLASRIVELGGTIHYNTAVDSLLKDADGKITGVTAATYDTTTGTEKYTINAKAVLLASGGFAKNKEMLEKYVPELADQYFNCAGASEGDGIRLGLDAGAVMECADGRPLPAYLSSWERKFELAFIHTSTPGLMVNASGKQFANIKSQNHQVMAACKIDESNGNVFYYVFDEAGVPVTKDFEAYGFNGYVSIFESGECVHYDTVQACADACNLPNLVETVETNNAQALAGEKNEFGGTPAFLDTRNGIWAIRVDPTYYLTVAGLQIDPQCHVTKGGYETGTYDVIPGLYAAGDVCGSIEEKDGKQYGMGFDCALSYGYIAAETIAAEI